ncbi:MAG: hypothetical protein HYU87_09185 [Chloroflexi bacterium]|nr:hypothetical protein [Chloroflexota bacterium]
MRIVVLTVFAAALASTFAGAGLVVVPHQEPAGSGPLHEHTATVYRFPLLLLGDAPGVPSVEELAHHVQAAHTAHLRALLGLAGSSVGSVHPLAELAAGTVLALLVIAVPRLPRPARRAVADIPIPTIVDTQWRSPLTSPPPRVRVFVSA